MGGPGATATAARTLPLRQFILKVHGRCNLACDHCYVYTMADQRWRGRPRAMSARTVERTAARIAEHVRDHGVDAIEVVLHGGEPMLAGVERLRHCVSAVRAAVGPGVRVGFAMQTNGTLLTDAALDALAALGIRVSVSVDGDAQAHDRHRVGHDGRGSYAAVSAALRRLGSARHRAAYAGLLCTVDLANDPLRTYESLLAFDPPAVDFLLPHGNWTNPPPGRVPGDPRTPYADWLIPIFDRWYGAPETGVRLFEEIIAVALGGRSRVEGVGLSPSRMVVVETDGGIESSDMLTSSYEGASATGLHVDRDPFDRVPRPSPVVVPPTGCGGCPVRRLCGGGLRAHRYREGSGFDNPSAYCPDLFRLVGHIRDRVAADLAALARGRG
ncbi:FxsB family cyclophane-forming radical SAM/SPASM peptide maturase [Actinokineospora auranticolor]|uniref:Radical SAM core domain-containing protein n=1 Tax=Actinokineospora auranticolor TaxID=155976 RepID=A0A2S6GQY4_9PSEU|nr:FxsB family cyclophane-forming radical SAM/SPASM peptide maturase [Actinokineospora auranticolor]PPK67609.1 uncharacterized protein CLV40_107275 [Actinokineospora auranticolor]